jgi:poly(hydroxyalkanoate) granule-associated protein
MAEKLKDVASGVPEAVAARIQQSASQIWLAGLGAFAKAQEEGGKIFDALVKEGEAVQEQTRKVAGERIAELAAQASGRWGKTWGRLEQLFEDRMAHALHGLNMPTKKDIDTLNQRVAKLTAVTEKISPAPGKGSRAAKSPTEHAYEGKKPKARRSR